MKNIIKGLLISAFAIFVFTGCGAEGELEDMGIAYTQDDYFKHGVYKKNTQVMDLFYEAGMPVETGDKDGDTALDNAIYKGHFDFMKFLIEEHDAKIKDKSLTTFIRKNFRGEEKDEKVLLYLFSKGAKLTDKGADRLSRYFTNSKTMETGLILTIAKNGLSAKESTYRLEKIYKNFANYVRNKRRNTKSTFKEINDTAEKLLPLINQLIKNGADVKRAYSRFDIPLSVAKDKSNWIKILLKPLIDTGKIDINKDFVLYDRPALVQSVFGIEKIEEMKETVQYLLELGADPLVKMKDDHYRYGNRNAVSMFCRYSTGLKTNKRQSSFYPEICQIEDVELFKLLFTDKAKYEKLKSANSNLIKAAKAFEDKNYKQAFSLYMPYAKNGDANAQEKIADLYSGRKGVKENYSEAAKWYKKAANQGINKAQYMLGIYYKGGLGVKKDKAEAKKWFEKAYESANSSRQKKIIKKAINKL